MRWLRKHPWLEFVFWVLITYEAIRLLVLVT